MSDYRWPNMWKAGWHWSGFDVSLTAPLITVQPVSQSVNYGSVLSLSVTATGTAPLAYQWKKNSVDIGGATSATYTVANSVVADAGSYTVTISNVVGITTSDAATVSVAIVLPNYYENNWAVTKLWWDSNISVQTETVALVGATVSGSEKWHGGVLAPNGCIYGLPSQATTVLKINTANDGVGTTGSLAAGSFGKLSGGTTNVSSYYYAGGVLAADGSIYAVPYKSARILRIIPGATANDADTILNMRVGGGTTGSECVVGVFAYGTYGGGWCGGALAPNGCIYCAPFDAPHILKIDPVAGTTTGIGTSVVPSTNNITTKFNSIVLGSDGYLYCIPGNRTEILKINPATDAVTLITGMGSQRYSGIVGNDGYLYLPPDSTTNKRMAKFDVANATIASVGDTYGGSTQNWAWSAIGLNNNIYALPWYGSSQTLMKYNMTTGGISSASTGVSGGFRGAILAPNGSIYGIPFDSTRVIKVLAGLETAMDSKFPLSMRFNKL